MLKHKVSITCLFIVVIASIILLLPLSSIPEGEIRTFVTRTKANLGNREAQFDLAKMYHFGEGVEKDPKEAFKLYTKPAEQGNSNAQLNLGTMYDQGEGVSQNYTEAFKWYTKAAEQGQPPPNSASASALALALAATIKPSASTPTIGNGSSCRIS